MQPDRIQLRLAIALCAVLAACATLSAQTQSAPAQQTDSGASTSGPEPIPAKVKIYTSGAGIVPPEFLPRDFSGELVTDCPQTASADEELTFLVDADGKPNNISFVYYVGYAIDNLAVGVLRQDRFKPATLNSAPVASALTVKMKLDGCAVEASDSAGMRSRRLHLHSQPEQQFAPWKGAPSEAILDSASEVQTSVTPLRVGRDVSPPVATFTPPPEFSDAARRAKFQGNCTITLIVDANGMPQNAHILKPLGKGLDEEALKAVMRYRFRPALRDGTPVPVYLTIAVNFRLYGKP
jgi:TonB family protein